MLKIIQVGHMEASDRYIRNKMKAIREANLEAELVNLPESCTTMDIVEELIGADLDDHCTAVMVQLPLPANIDKDYVLRNIPPEKDIDGLNPYSDYKPLTPSAIMRWFDEKMITLQGTNVVILGRSELVGKPLANMLIERGATVTVMNSHTTTGTRCYMCANAEIIISAVGQYGIVDERCVNAMLPQVVVDVGINRNEERKLCGDVSKEAREIINYDGICTPVPGGVGKWTVRELILRLQEMESSREKS